MAAVLLVVTGLFSGGASTRPEIRFAHTRVLMVEQNGEPDGAQLMDGDSLSENESREVPPSVEQFPLLWPAAGTALALSLLYLFASRQGNAEETAEPQNQDLSWRNWANLAAYALNALVTYGSLTGIFGPDNATLSAKYQTLVSPAGFAFAIWGPIFIGEGLFAVAQMSQNFRGSKVVELATPGWLTASFFQICWSVIFAQEMILLALVCMLGILAGLLWIASSADGLAMTWAEYGTLRWAFSVHLGWIIAASAVNANVLADFWKAPPIFLFPMALISIGAVFTTAALLSLGKTSPDPIVCLVTAWAFNGIRVELSNPTLLDDPTRHNPWAWDKLSLFVLEVIAMIGMALALVLAAVAAVRASRAASRSDAGPEKGGDDN